MRPCLFGQQSLQDGKKTKRKASDDNKDGSKFKTYILSHLFGLMEPYQRDTTLQKLISDHGIVNKIHNRIKQLGRNGIVQCLVRSALERKHLDKPAGSDEGIFLDAVPELVSVEDAAALRAGNGEGLRDAEEFGLELFLACFQNGSLLSYEQKKLLCTINKRCLSNYFKATNQTIACPGKDKKPVLSVFSTPIIFRRETLLEYEHSLDALPKGGDESKGKDGRRFSIEFTVLVVDSAIRRLADGNDDKQQRALDNFRKIFEALDRDGWLFAVISKNPDSLSVDGKALFDSARLEIVENAINEGKPAKVPGGGSSKKGAQAEEDGVGVGDDDDDTHRSGTGKRMFG